MWTDCDQSRLENLRKQKYEAEKTVEVLADKLEAAKSDEAEAAQLASDVDFTCQDFVDYQRLCREVENEEVRVR